MPHARWAPSNHENPPGLLVRVTVTKDVSFRVVRLRELLKTRNVTQSCPEPPFILREPQDERRVEGDDTGIVAITVGRDLYFLSNEITILGYGELEDELTVMILQTSPSTTMLSESQM